MKRAGKPGAVAAALARAAAVADVRDTVMPDDAAWLRLVHAGVSWAPGKVTISVVSKGKTLVWGTGPTFADALAAARDADDAWTRLVPDEDDEEPLPDADEADVLPSGE